MLGGAVDAFVAKTSQLGQALNPLTADLEALIAASGNVNNTSLLIKELEAADLSAAALMVATEELAILVGRDGVDALNEFGSDTVQLAMSSIKQCQLWRRVSLRLPMLLAY